MTGANVVEALTSCDECRRDIYPINVFRVVPVPKVPGHVALVYKCNFCGEVGKMASTEEEWNELEEQREDTDSDIEAQVALARFDLDQEITVEFIEQHWKAQKYPPHKETLTRCMCEDCVRRRGV